MKAVTHLNRTLLLCLAAFAPSTTWAQRSFDVVSIRQMQHDDANYQMSIMNPSKQGRFRASGITVRMLLGLSFGVPQDRIVGGPSWIDENLYSIDAQLDPDGIAKLQNLSDEEARTLRCEMLQSMLSDRFKLQFHKSNRMAAVYEIVATADSAQKMVAESDSPPSPRRFAVTITGDRMTFQHASLTSIAEILGQNLDLPVLDKTGLKGFYNATLAWTPALRRTEADSASSQYLLSSALLHDCGLKLVRAKGEVETIAVDQISLPTAN